MSDNQIFIDQELPKPDLQTKDTPDDKINEYSIYDYFRLHPSVFIATVSAMVAIVSYLINYAIFRYNSAYLTYWNIDNMYASSFPHNKIYIVFFAFLCCFVLMLVHYFMSRTSDVYHHHHKLLSILRLQTRSIRAKRRQLLQSEKKFKRILAKMPTEKPKECSKEIDNITEEINSCKKDLSELLDLVGSVKEARKQYANWLFTNVIISILGVYILGLILSLLSASIISLNEILKRCLLVAIVIGLDVLIYFVPAHISSTFTKSKLKKIEMDKFLSDCLNTEKHRFPLSEFANHGFKIMFSNKKIKLVLSQLLLTASILMFVVSSSGHSEAKGKTSFDIYTDNADTYVIIYNNGEVAILEGAEYSEKTIRIDTSKQRIISVDEISYMVLDFEKVEVINSSVNPSFK